MKKALVIAMLIIAMGLVGCPRNYHDRDRDNRGYDHRHDQGHDNGHHDHDNDDDEHRR